MIRMYSTVMVAGNVVVESGDPGQFPPTARLLHGEGQAEGMVGKPPSNLVPPTRHSMHVLVDPDCKLDHPVRAPFLLPHERTQNMAPEHSHARKTHTVMKNGMSKGAVAGAPAAVVYQPPEAMLDGCSVWMRVPST